MQTVTNTTKKISPAAGFLYSYISISTIFSPRRNLFLPTPLLETALYAYMNPPRGCQNVLTPFGGKKISAPREFFNHAPTTKYTLWKKSCAKGIFPKDIL